MPSRLPGAAYREHHGLPGGSGRRAQFQRKGTPRALRARAAAAYGVKRVCRLPMEFEIMVLEKLPAPSEYVASGRFFCTIERHEGEDLFNYVTSVFGDDVLMYASDYPHSECQFPDSVDNIFKWSSLKPDTRRKLLWDNAARFYRES